MGGSRRRNMHEKKNRLFFFMMLLYLLFRFLKLFKLVLRSCLIHRLIKRTNEGFRSFQHDFF